MTYRKGTPGYKVLTDHVRERANKIVLQLAKATPDDYVLVEAIHKETGEPYGPRGMVRSLAAALSVIDAYKGLIPPNWGHHILGPKSNGIPANQPVNNAHATNCHVRLRNQQSHDWDTALLYSNLDD